MPVGRIKFSAIALGALMLSSAGVANPANDLAGRYSAHFANGTIDGGKYWSDDVLEIVPVDERSAYFRIELNFFNGHVCRIGGVARVDGKALEYRGHPFEPFGNALCHMTIYREGANVRMDDNGGSCQQTCGSRGGYLNARLPWRSKRPIRYMDRLKASPEFREALGSMRKK